MLACQVDPTTFEDLQGPPVKGKVWQMDNAQGLTENLKQALGMYTVPVEPKDARRGERRANDRGRSSPRASPARRARDKYSAKLPNQSDSSAARFAVEADEKLTLYLEKQGSGRLTLVHRHDDFSRQAKPFPSKVGSPAPTPIRTSIRRRSPYRCCDPPRRERMSHSA